MKEIRLLPLVMIAAGAMLALRVTTFALGEPPQIAVGQAHAQAVAEDPLDETSGPAPVPDTVTGLNQTLPGGSDAASAIETSLAARRAELEAKASDLELREKLLSATQQRVEERIGELEAIEQRLDALMAKRSEEEEARFAALVEMYGKMKPKDAARIMNGLDMAVLQRVVEKITPRQMSEIMANMDAGVAQKLTMELSEEAPQLTVEAAQQPGELPKIVGTRNP